MAGGSLGRLESRGLIRVRKKQYSSGEFYWGEGERKRAQSSLMGRGIERKGGRRERKQAGLCLLKGRAQHMFTETAYWVSMQE